MTDFHYGGTPGELAIAAKALREAAVAFGHMWQSDQVPAPTVYQALRERADWIESTSEPASTHPFDPGYTGMSTACNSLVERDGHGADCGLPREHPLHTGPVDASADLVTWAMPREDARDLLRWLRHNRPIGMPDRTFDGLIDALIPDRASGATEGESDA